MRNIDNIDSTLPSRSMLEGLANVGSETDTLAITGFYTPGAEALYLQAYPPEISRFHQNLDVGSSIFIY